MVRAYGAAPPLDRLLHGLATVATALNDNERCLAHIAAVHLTIPDLPNLAARDLLEVEDRLIKYARDEGSGGDGGYNWNPALHPRIGTPPNPGWFAPTDGADAGATSIRTAQNDDPNQAPDASRRAGDNWVRLRAADRIDELADFAEWLANAQPQDEQAIRDEIKRYFQDVGWDSAAHDLNSKLSVVLRPGVTQETRQRVLDSIDLYTRADPAEYVGTRDFLNTLVLATTPLLGGKPPTDEPSPAWQYGWAKRGQEINKVFGDNSFPKNYPVIDKIPNGVATSVKSIDLNAATYQNEASLEYRLEDYVTKVQGFDGRDWGGLNIRDTDISGRAVQLIIPKGSMTDAQLSVIERVRARALRDSEKPVNIVITEY